jgi:hypothetical protein
MYNQEGGGDGVEQPAQLPEGGKGGRIRGAKADLGEKEDQVEDQGFHEAVDGLLLLTVFSGCGIVY